MSAVKVVLLILFIVLVVSVLLFFLHIISFETTAVLELGVIGAAVTLPPLVA